MKKIILVVVILVASQVYSQQDSQYTQYMYNTMNVNSAYAGSRGVFSVFGMYRTQWVGLEGAPDSGIFSVNAPAWERVGLGVTFENDRIGISSENTLSADFSYSIPFPNDYTLSFGLKATAHLLNVDYNKLNIQSGDPILSSNNNIDNQFSPNVGAGIYFHSDKFYAGFSIPNILETKHYDDNIESTAKEKQHLYLISGYVFDLRDDILFKPAFLAKAVAGSPLQLDVTGNFMFDQRFVLGVAWRWSAAISGLAGFHLDRNWFIGYAYDSETTRLAKYNSGSHEVFLRYEFVVNKKQRRIISPRFF